MALITEPAAPFPSAGGLQRRFNSATLVRYVSVRYPRSNVVSASDCAIGPEWEAGEMMMRLWEAANLLHARSVGGPGIVLTILVSCGMVRSPSAYDTMPEGG